MMQVGSVHNVCHVVPVHSAHHAVTVSSVHLALITVLHPGITDMSELSVSRIIFVTVPNAATWQLLWTCVVSAVRVWQLCPKPNPPDSTMYAQCHCAGRIRKH